MSKERYLTLALTSYAKLDNRTLLTLAEQTWNISLTYFSAVMTEIQVEDINYKKIIKDLQWSPQVWSQLAKIDKQIYGLDLAGISAQGCIYFDIGVNSDFSDAPYQLIYAISENLFPNKTIPPDFLQQFVDLSKQLFLLSQASTGLITFDQIVGTGFSWGSPYERITEHTFILIRTKFQEFSRGYYWGNFLSKGHVDKLGGVKTLAQAPVQIVETLGTDLYYLQLNQDINTITTEELNSLREWMSPILLGVNPKSVFRPDHGYLLVLPEPPELYKPYPQSSQTFIQKIISYIKFIKGILRILFQLTRLRLNQQPSENEEALTWLKNNQNASPLAGNRFEGKEAAVAFVQQLYHLGAEKVYVSMIWDEEWRIQQDGGPYATGLKVVLNSEQKGLEALTTLFMEELENEGVLENEEFLQALERSQGQLFENGVLDMYWD